MTTPLNFSQGPAMSSVTSGPTTSYATTRGKSPQWMTWAVIAGGVALFWFMWKHR